MKLALLLAAVIAVVLAFGTARAVEDPPEPHLQLVEVEQMTPYLESASITATSQTQSRIVRQSGGTFSSQAYALFDNHNGDGSRATFPLEVDEADTYGVSAVFARGPGYGIVQLAIDGRPVGAPFDGYAAAAGQAPAVPLGTVALAEGKHMLSMTVTGRNAAATDWLAGLDLLVLDSEAAAQPTPTAVATTEVGGTVPPTLSLTLGASGPVRGLPARRGARVHGVDDGERDLVGRRRGAQHLGAGAPAERVVHAAAAAAGEDRAGLVGRPGVERAR